jgi:hypothetical protein
MKEDIQNQEGFLINLLIKLCKDYKKTNEKAFVIQETLKIFYRHFTI